MEYGKIISVTGMGGLFELVGSKKDGAIVKSLEDKTTKFVSSRIHNFSHLESIEVYTVRDNINLVDLLKAMDESGKALPDQKDAAAIKAYFQEVYPDMDFERVYASDMKKMVKWYSILKANDVEFKLTEMDEEEEGGDEQTVTESTAAIAGDVNTEENSDAEETPKSKGKASAKTNAKATEATDESEPAEAPKKRAPRKKKTEEE